jgi:hypothetical protein
MSAPQTLPKSPHQFFNFITFNPWTFTITNHAFPSLPAHSHVPITPSNHHKPNTKSTRFKLTITTATPHLCRAPKPSTVPCPLPHITIQFTFTVISSALHSISPWQFNHHPCKPPTATFHHFLQNPSSQPCSQTTAQLWLPCPVLDCRYHRCRFLTPPPLLAQGPARCNPQQPRPNPSLPSIQPVHAIDAA